MVHARTTQRASDSWVKQAGRREKGEGGGRPRNRDKAHPPFKEYAERAAKYRDFQTMDTAAPLHSTRSASYLASKA